MEPWIVGTKLFGSVAILVVQIYESKKVLRGIKPNQFEMDRREKAKSDPSVVWERIDELSYSGRALLICIDLWLRIAVIILWCIFCSFL